MSGFKQTPAQGQSSSSINGQIYGQTVFGDAVPIVIGRQRAALKLIWANGHRTGNSGKKFKQSKKKGSQVAYVQNCDFLIGSTNIFDLLTIYRNKDVFGLLESSQSGSIAAGNVFTITNCPGGYVCVAVLGVTIQQTYSQPVNDFGGPGPRDLSGTTQVPCMRLGALVAPVYKAANTSDFPFPFVYDDSGFSAVNPEIVFDHGTFPTWVGATCTVYYAYALADRLPLAQLNLQFEKLLASGTEYTNFPSQQLYYSDVAGAGSDALDLGSADSIPTLTAECTGNYPINEYGEALPTDALQLLFGAGADPLNTGTTVGMNLLSVYDSAYRSAFYSSGGGGTPVFFEPTSLANARAFCQANGIYCGAYIDSQQNASQWAQEFLDMMNCDALWTGFSLKLIPRSEVSAYGDGALYTPPCASGPVAVLGPNQFKVKKGSAPLKISRIPQPQAKNIVPLQHIDSQNQYNQALTTWPDQANISQRGAFTDTAQTFDTIARVAVAQIVASMIVQRNVTLLATYSFVLGPEWGFLEPRDLIELNEPNVGIQSLPARLTKMVENEDKEWQCEAEDFFYGTNAPSAEAYESAQNTPITTNADPGNISDAILFSMPPRLKTTGSPFEIGAMCCSPDPNWGGAAVFISNDNFATTSVLAGTIAVGCTMGRLTADYPNTPDPDTTDTLAVDLSESDGALQTATTAQQDAFASLAFLSGASGFEIIGYSTVSSLGSGLWHLSPTIRRGFLASVVEDHPTNSQFGLIDATTLHIAVDPNWIGQTLYVKFCSFNTYGQQQQSLADVTAITYSPTGQGTPPNPSYTINPQTPVSQPSGGGVGTLVVAPFTANFSTGTVKYLGKTITIGAPSVPTVYWVTIADPGQIGEGGGNPTETYYADTNNTRATEAGYTFCGMITATATGGVTGGQGGSAGPR